MEEWSEGLAVCVEEGGKWGEGNGEAISCVVLCFMIYNLSYNNCNCCCINSLIVVKQLNL